MFTLSFMPIHQLFVAKFSFLGPWSFQFLQFDHWILFLVKFSGFIYCLYLHFLAYLMRHYTLNTINSLYPCFNQLSPAAKHFNPNLPLLNSNLWHAPCEYDGLRSQKRVFSRLFFFFKINWSILWRVRYDSVTIPTVIFST